MLHIWQNAEFIYLTWYKDAKIVRVVRYTAESVCRSLVYDSTPELGSIGEDFDITY